MCACVRAYARTNFNRWNMFTTAVILSVKEKYVDRTMAVVKLDCSKCESISLSVQFNSEVIARAKKNWSWWKLELIWNQSCMCVAPFVVWVLVTWVFSVFFFVLSLMRLLLEKKNINKWEHEQRDESISQPTSFCGCFFSFVFPPLFLVLIN